MGVVDKLRALLGLGKTQLYRVHTEGYGGWWVIAYSASSASALGAMSANAGATDAELYDPWRVVWPASMRKLLASRREGVVRLTAGHWEFVE
jgi:hypothetical protein